MRERLGREVSTHASTQGTVVTTFVMRRKVPDENGAVNLAGVAVGREQPRKKSRSEGEGRWRGSGTHGVFPSIQKSA
jgi:hypothetical protein